MAALQLEELPAEANGELTILAKVSSFAIAHRIMQKLDRQVRAVVMLSF